jgi:hypothetical protein
MLIEAERWEAAYFFELGERRNLENHGADKDDNDSKAACAGQVVVCKTRSKKKPIN